MVLPNQKAIAKINTLMEDGVITDEKLLSSLKNLTYFEQVNDKTYF